MYAKGLTLLYMRFTSRVKLCQAEQNGTEGAEQNTASDLNFLSVIVISLMGSCARPCPVHYVMKETVASTAALLFTIQ